MNDFYIRNKETAKKIIEVYKKCGTCSECILHIPEGWMCTYQYDKAVEYLKKHEGEN
ncbi:hypothetical protein [Gemmiger sp.]